MSDRKRSPLIAAALALPLALSAAAGTALADDDDAPPLWQPPPTAAFAGVDIEALADDQWDRWAIRDIRGQWNEGVRNGDTLAMQVAEDRLLRWLEAERAEDRAEVAREQRELSLAQDMRDAPRVAVQRMELTRARADLAQTERALQQLAGLRLAAEEGRATGAHLAAQAALLERLERMADDEVFMTLEENREEREAYLDELRARGTYEPAV